MRAFLCDGVLHDGIQLHLKRWPGELTKGCDDGQNLLDVRFAYVASHMHCRHQQQVGTLSREREARRNSIIFFTESPWQRKPATSSVLSSVSRPFSMVAFLCFLSLVAAI